MPERLKKFRVENQLQLPRFVQTLLETARWTPRTRQRPQWTLPQTAMPQNLFHDVSLTAFDETDDFHPGPTLRALQRIDFKHPFDQSGPTRSRPARFGLGGRSCLIDKPPVNLHFVARRLLGADPSAPIRIPSEISDQMFSLVRDVLREFREEIERVENLKVGCFCTKGRKVS